MPTVIDEFDSLYHQLKRWARDMNVSEDTLMIVTSGLMVFEIERRGWLNRTEELQRSQRIASAARDAITRELGSE